jgi:putative aldouronate transport system substrate-binding protein
MKKLLLTVAVLFMLGTLLTGCQQAQTTTTKAGTSATTTATTKGTEATTVPTEPEHYDLYFWLASAPNTTPIDNGWTERWFAERMPEITIHWIDPGDNLVTTTNLMISAGNIPEYMRDMKMTDYNKYYNEGIIRQLDPDIVEQHMPGYIDQLNRALGDMADPWLFVRRGDERMPYGAYQFWELGPYSRAIGIRQDWMENVGITKEPATLDEFEALMRAFTKEDPDGNGADDTFGLTGMTTDTLESFSYVFGAYGTYPGVFTISEAGKVLRGEIEPGTKEALTVLNRWYSEGYLDPEFMVNQNDNMRGKVVNQKAGSVLNWWYTFYPAAVFYSGYFVENMKDTPAKWITIEPPVGPDNFRGTRQRGPTSSMIMFSSEVSDEKLAKYLQAIQLSAYTIDGIIARFYGEEGVTYVKKDDGAYEYIEPYNDVQKRRDYGIFMVAGNMNDYVIGYPTSTPAHYKDLRTAAEAKNYGDYDRLGTMLSLEAFNENKDRLDQLTTIAFVEFITGDRKLDTFDAYVAEWLSKGGQDVLEEAQEQYDALVAK